MNKSVRSGGLKLAKELRARGHEVSQSTVWRLLDKLGYSMRSNRKSREGTNHPDRDEQFEFINATAKEFLEQGRPVISVDTKKKELTGNYKTTRTRAGSGSGRASRFW